MQLLKHIYTLANIKTTVRHSQGCEGYLGSDSPKSTKFGPDVTHVKLFGFLMGPRQRFKGRHIGKIQNGRHPGEMTIAI